MSAKPWPRESVGIEDALRRRHEGRLGAPTESDRPPVSTFPMTKAARAALRMTKNR